MIQWPPHSKIICYDEEEAVIAESKRSRIDLADSLMLIYSGAEPLECTIEVSTKSNDWGTWNTENVRKIESHIRDDLEFDGYQVEIHRLSKPGKTLCSKPFSWNLRISIEASESNSDRELVGSRFKVARSDASVKTIQQQIEKVFGLPRGSVCLQSPELEKFNPRSTIKKLRKLWKYGE